MEREIIFRGKRIDNGEWVEGDLIHERFGVCIQYIVDDVRTKVKIDQETIGQYTGLKDKNGKRIFEDDVLNCVSDDCEYDYKTKVYPCGNTLCVDIVGQEGDYTAIDFAYDYWDNENCNVEIIGNIYDNPGLLEVQ